MTTRRRPTTPAPILPGFEPGGISSSPAAPPCVREALEYFRSVHADPAAVPERPDPVKGPADVAAIAAILIAAASSDGPDRFDLMVEDRMAEAAGFSPYGPPDQY